MKSHNYRRRRVVAPSLFLCPYLLWNRKNPNFYEKEKKEWIFTES